MDTADRIAALMNDMLVTDGIATQRLVNTRVRCNRELAVHPTIQVGVVQGYVTVYEVGLLGILNGLCAEGRRVVAVIDEITLNIVRFEARDV